MLNNLKAELVRKGLNPIEVISKTIDCTEKTARSKVNGITAFTVPEAIKIKEVFFADSELTFEYLFSTEPVAS